MLKIKGRKKKPGIIEELAQVNFVREGRRLCSEDAGAADSLDLLLSALCEELGADDKGLLGETALSEDLKVASVSDVDDRDGGALLPVLADVLGDEVPETVDVHRRAEVVVVVEVEHTHAVLAKVAGMVAVKQRAVVVLATSVTATSRVLTLTDNTTVTHLHVATHLPALLKVSSHIPLNKNKKFSEYQ